MTTFNREKFKTLVHFICARCEKAPSQLGSTKLNKILWFIEVNSFLRTGEPMTGAKFIKRQYGPVPLAVLPIIAELEQEQALFVRDVEYFGKPKKEYISLKEPDLDGFSGKEVELIDYMIRAVCDRHTAKSISDFTHNSVWKMAAIGEELPIYTSLALPGEVTEEDIAWADQRILELAS